MSDALRHNDGAWDAWRNQWSLDQETIYLNHGAFGPSPRPVVAERIRWIEHIESHPWEFFLHELDFELARARSRLAEFVGAAADDLAFVENATTGMNAVAVSMPLAAGDEVLLTDHEYGAVRRLWERTCHRQGATLKIASLPRPIESAEQVVEAVMAAAGPDTRLLVFSHVTSPTAVVLPAAELTAAARQRGIAVCIDGPHAIAMVDVNLPALDCDYYTASCHKWLSAPFGSGFLYVHPRAQGTIEPAILSWGRTPAGEFGAKPSWRDEFNWAGTRDASSYLAIPAAIDFLQSLGLDEFRRRTHALAQYARRRVINLTGLTPLVPDDVRWYGSMATFPLPPGDALPLQLALWQEYRIAVPIVAWQDSRWIRVSCHLHTRTTDIDALVTALSRLL